MEFVQNFTPPGFQAKNFTPSISPNFNSFSKKKHKKWVKMEKFTPLAKILHSCREWREWQIPPLTVVSKSFLYFSPKKTSNTIQFPCPPTDSGLHPNLVPFCFMILFYTWMNPFHLVIYKKKVNLVLSHRQPFKLFTSSSAFSSHSSNFVLIPRQRLTQNLSGQQRGAHSTGAGPSN